MSLGKMLAGYTQENIHFQRGNSYFNEIVICVKYLMDHPGLGSFTTIKKTINPDVPTQTAIIESGFEEMVLKNTNMLCRLVIEGDSNLDAAVIVPTVDRNNPVKTPHRRIIESQGRMTHRLMDLNKKYTQYVDLSTGKVGGDATEMQVVFFITRGLLSGKLTPEEVAAIIAHEIGHAVNNFIFLGRTQVITAVAHDIINMYNGSVPIKTKVELLGVISDLTNVPDMDSESMAYADAGTAAGLYLSAAARAPVSMHSSGPYDLKNFEAMADQYVVRLGAAKHFSSGMRKMIDPNGYRDRTRGSFFRQLMNSMRGGAYGIPANILVTLQSLDPEGKYDMPAERLERVRREVIQSSKSAITIDERRELDDIVVSITEDLNRLGKDPKLSSLIKKIGGYESSYAGAKIKLMQEIEQLASNDLYARSNRLTILLGK